MRGETGQTVELDSVRENDSAVTRIMLVHDQMMFREIAGKVISEQPDMAVVMECGTICIAKQSVAEREIDLVIAGMTLVDGCGTVLTSELKAATPDIKVILLSPSEEESSLISAIECGADGYVVKRRSFDVLLSAVRAVMDGEYVYDQSVCSTVLRSLVMRENTMVPVEEDITATTEGLSPRECQALELLVRGLTNKEIAQELSISVSTTKTHVSNVFRQVGVSSRRELLPKYHRLAKIFSNAPADTKQQ